MKMSLCAFPQVRIFEDYDKMSAKEVYFNEAGNKITVKLLHFPNVPPEEMHKINFEETNQNLREEPDINADEVNSNNATENEEVTDEEDCVASDTSEAQAKKVLRKKAANNSMHLRKCSFAFAQAHGLKNILPNATPTINMIPATSPTPRINLEKRSPSPQGVNILCPGYTQYSKSLLEVPLPRDYGYASSDDLSSEWDSDVPVTTQNKKVSLKKD